MMVGKSHKRFVPSANYNVGDVLTASLRQGNDNWLRRFYPPSDVTHDDGTPGRVHPCTNVTCCKSKHPILVTWTSMEMSQTLPDNQKALVHGTQLRMTHSMETNSENDTDENCLEGEEAGNVDEVHQMCEMKNSLEAMTAKLKETEADNERLRLKCKSLMMQLMALGVAPNPKFEHTEAGKKWLKQGRIPGGKRQRK